MKKFTIIGLAICLAFALAAPAAAVDVDFSGHYYVRGAYTEHWNLRDTSASNAYMDMQFRLQTVFKVNDILSVTTRFDALDDKVWGEGAETVDNIDFDRAYMTIKAPIGTFYIGRMKGSAFGTTFVDSETERDRIIYAKVIDNLTFKALYQKTTEQDDYMGTEAQAVAAGIEAAAVAYLLELDDTDGNFPAARAAADDAYDDAYAEALATAADEDSDFYALLGAYEMENVTAGLLLGFGNNKTAASSTTHEYHFNPYFVSKFGPLAIQGELYYKWGETDYDAAGSVDLDIKKLAYNLEATYNVGPASIMAGYAFVSGDGDGNADDENSAYGSVGDDWEKLFILTTSQVGALQNLGGVGNLSAGGGGADPYGAKIIYGGATFSPLDNLELGVVVGNADADEIPVGMTKDDYGLEYDFTLNWKIYDNLTYSAVAAFLEAGDLYWNETGATTKPATFDDTYALFHQLELSF